MQLNKFGITNKIWDDLMKQNENINIIQNALTGALFKNVSGQKDVELSEMEATNGLLVFTGTLTDNVTVTVPDVPRVYHVQNQTSGDYTLTIKTGAGTGVPIQQANLPNHPRIKRVLCDGTDITWADGSQIVEDNLHEETPDAGYYIRWANRLQKCWNYFGTIEGITPTGSSSNLPVTVYKYDIDINFPKPFATNYPFIACNANPQHYGDMGVQALQQSPNHFIMRIHSLAEFTLVYNVSYMAVGRY